MRLCALVAFVCMGILLAAPRVARADERTAAREHFQKGIAYQQQAAYAQAIEEYEAAYALAPLAELLFDIAQCYRLQGNAGKAIEYYRRYVAADANGRGVNEARRHIAELTDEPPVVPSPETNVVTPPPPPPPAAQPDAAKVPPRNEPSVMTRTDLAAAPTPPAARGRGRNLRIAGTVGVGLGVAVAGVGLWEGLHIRRLQSEIEGTAQWGDDYNQKIRDGERGQIIMYVCYGVGGALVVGGAVLYLLGRADHGTPSDTHVHASGRLTITPVVGAVSGLSLAGEF